MDGWAIEWRDREKEQRLGLLFTCKTRKVNAHKTWTIPERNCPSPSTGAAVYPCLAFVFVFDSLPPASLSTRGSVAALSGTFVYTVDKPSRFSWSTQKHKR